MADNDWNLPTSGAGPTVATDDIGGFRFQRVKLVHGADGTNDGDTAATNPLPVKLQSQDTTAEVSTTPLANGVSFTTAWFDTQDAPHGFTVAVSSDVAGHTYHEESPNNDGTNIILADDFAYTQAEMVAGVDEEHISHTRYSRFRVTNDSGTGQAALIYSVTQRFLDGYGTVKISASANDVTAHGDKQHNTATASTEAIEALTAVAKAAAPTYGEGNIVAPRVTLTGDTAVTLDGEPVVLGAGSAAIGKLVANSGVDIGDVDVLSLPANASVNVSQINGVTPLMGAGNTGTGSPRVTIASDQAAVPVKAAPATSGGQSGYTAISTAAVLSASVKNSAGQVFGYSFFNNTAAAIFVRLYNMTTAPGTGDTPVRRIMVPKDGGVERVISNGMEFTTGIGIRATGAAPDNDATALTANTVLFNVDYK